MFPRKIIHNRTKNHVQLVFILKTFIKYSVCLCFVSTVKPVNIETDHPWDLNICNMLCFVYIYRLDNVGIGTNKRNLIHWLLQTGCQYINYEVVNTAHFSISLHCINTCNDSETSITTVIQVTVYKCLNTGGKSEKQVKSQ